MRNKKLLFVLIPVIVVVVALLAGIVFLALNGSPEKIFKSSVNKVFGMLKTTEEEYSTMKGTINLTANIESDDENVQALNTMLGGAAIELNMEADTTNMIINENLNVKYNNENLLNASILLQDEKGYVYLPDWLNKYLELPEELLEYSDLTEYYEKLDTLDQGALIEAIEEELIIAISNQELIQEKTTLVLNGQETKVTASTLSLNSSELLTFTKDFTTNLKENEKFKKGLGEFKEDYILVLEEALQTLDTNTDISNNDEINEEFIFTIYTKGFLNKFVGVSAKTIDTYWEETVGLNLFRHNDGKYEFVAYDEYDGEKEELFRAIVENKKENKNKGMATITITVDGEEAVGKVNLNCTYDFTYDAEILKVDTRNSVLIDELSEEDQTTFSTNLKKSTIYEVIEQSSLLDSILAKSKDKPEVTYDGYTVKYSVPDGFETSGYNSNDYKIYMDKDNNSICVSIEWDSVDEYLRSLEDNYILTTNFYENQKISSIKTYTINGKEYKCRTITYNDAFGSYVDLYFIYELDNEYCYVVKVETEPGKLSIEDVKKFLDIII